MLPSVYDPGFYTQARLRLPQDRAVQQSAAPSEHREFVRDAVANDPLAMAPALAVAIPAYTGMKKFNESVRSHMAGPTAYNPSHIPAIALYLALQKAGMTQSRSPASLDEIFAGYEGLFSGLKDRYAPGK
jgi:hypothetical protein